MKKQAFLILLVMGLLVLSLGVGLAGGVAFDRLVLLGVAPPNTVPSAAMPQFRLMAEAWNTIQRVYVDRTALQPKLLAYGAISGMVEALGDTGHSRFLSPEMLAEERKFAQGEFEGIGVEVQVRDRYVVVVAPIDGTPAQQAGLRPGDVILQVNGEDMTGLPLTEVMKRILGPAGTDVTLTLLNPATGKTRDVTLTRARIVIHNVTWQLVPGTTVAHVRIAGFSLGVTRDLREALTACKEQGATAAILDLRSNPGGVFDEAVGTASQFLASGNVLQVKDVRGQVQPIPVQGGGVATDMPLVVVINGGTASAGEIVAGALQDAHRATLVGEKTFGTGTVLSTVPLSDGSALLLATQEWLTPAGRVIWHQGIAPDVEVALPQDARPLLPETEKGMTAAQVQASGDAQVLRALETLLQKSAVKVLPGGGS